MHEFGSLVFVIKARKLQPDKPRKLTQLSDLRGTHLAELISPDPSKNQFIQTAPGKLFKVYNQKSKWVYHPQIFRLFSNIHSPKEIAHLKNNQSLEEIEIQLENCIQQLVIRAHNGSNLAASLLILKVLKCVHTFDAMADAGSPAIKKMAETATYWPVVLSLNPQDVARAKKRLDALHVGSKAMIPSNKGQRVDFQSLWTKLAKGAFEICSLNRTLVPKLLKFVKGVAYRRDMALVCGARMPAFFYPVSHVEAFFIMGWQVDCRKLPHPAKKENFDAWWSVVKCCVLDCWHSQRHIYKEALDKIKRFDESEPFRRNLAITQVRQAFRSLLR